MNWFTRKGKDNKDVSLNPFAKSDDNGGQDGQNNNGGGGQNNNGGQNNGGSGGQNNGGGADQTKLMRDALKNAGMYEGLDLATFKRAMTDGDDEALSGFFDQMMTNAASSALKLANQLADSKAAKAIETATNKASTETTKRLLRDEMYKQYEFLKEPALSPVAENILDKYMEQGLPPAEALKNVGEYFKATAQAAGKHFGMKVEEPANNGRPGSNGFRGDGRNQNDNNTKSDEEGDPDWFAALTGGAQTFDGFLGSQGNNSGSGGAQQ